METPIAATFANHSCFRCAPSTMTMKLSSEILQNRFPERSVSGQRVESAKYSDSPELAKLYVSLFIRYSRSILCHAGNSPVPRGSIPFDRPESHDFSRDPAATSGDREDRTRNPPNRFHCMHVDDKQFFVAVTFDQSRPSESTVPTATAAITKHKILPGIPVDH